MISFTSGEILLSLLYSLVYGVLFFIFYTLICLLKNEVGLLKSLPESIIRYDKILEKPIKMRGRIAKEQSPDVVAVSIIAFALGLVLLSYYALDGCVRIYLIIVSLTSFFAIKSLAFDKIFILLTSIFGFLIYLFTIALRIIIFPFLRLFSFFRKKSSVFCAFLKKILYKTRA